MYYAVIMLGMMDLTLDSPRYSKKGVARIRMEKLAVACCPHAGRAGLRADILDRSGHLFHPSAPEYGFNALGEG